MVDTFLEEALENLALWETTCLSFEEMDRDTSFNQLFRMAHNLKGSSLSVGLKEFGSAIHKVEELMTLLREKKLNFTPAILDLFFGIHSFATEWIFNLKENPKYLNKNRETFLDKVVSFIENKDLLVKDESTQAGVNQAEQEKQDFVKSQEIEKLGFGIFSEMDGIKTEKPQKLEEKAAINSLDKFADIAEKPKPNPHLKEELKTENKTTKKPVQDEYIRVHVNKLDILINYIGEIVVDQNIMRQKSANKRVPDDVENIISQMGKNILELQNIAMSLRMMPLEQQFQKMHRIVRDLSTRQDKEIHFESFGGDVELDKIIVEKLTDPLTHLIRNAVDHGIEDKKERADKNKPFQCHIELRAMQVEDRVKIFLKDDGRGLDEKKILKKAIEKGIVDKNENLSVDEIRRLIFRPGFSTKEEVSDISGRGVGLDVVNSVISDLKGVIEIESEITKGTEFSISLPSSLSIIKGVVVRLDEQFFVLPESQLYEIVDHNKVHLEMRANGSYVFTLRKEIIPVIPMKSILQVKTKGTQKSDRNGLVIQHSKGKVSFEVDEIIGTQSIVLKQLSKELYDLPGIVATTVLGNGEPALVLNLTNLVKVWEE